MSLSFPSASRLRASLGPHGVALIRSEGWLSTTVSDARVQLTTPIEAPAGPPARPWAAAIDSLRLALNGLARRGEALTVVLSNHWCHYVNLPALPSLASRDEDDAFARHTFHEVYGEAASQWTLRVSGDIPTVARYAAGIETELLEALRAAASAEGVRLASVQPLLMTAYNAWLSELSLAPTWFALCEPGRLCLSLCAPDGMRSVRNAPVGEDWQAELPHLIEREAHLQDSYEFSAPTEIRVFHPSQALPALAPRQGPGMRNLSLRELPLPGRLRAQDLALALVGA